MASQGPMSLVGAALLYLDRPDAPLAVGALAILPGLVSRDELVREVEGRLHRLPRLLQRPSPFPFNLAYPDWQDEAGFHARHHVHHWGLPAPGGVPSLCALTAQLVARPLRLDRPLWEMHLIDDLAEQRSAVLLRAHHALLEEIGGARVLELLLGRAVADGRPRRAPSPRPGDARSLRLLRALAERQRRRARWLRGALDPLALAALREQLRATLESARKLSPDEVPRLAWNAPLGGRRRVALLRLSLADMERIRRSQAATLDAALLAITAGGLQRFLSARSAGPVPVEAMALVPVRITAADRPGANARRSSLLRVRLPLRSADERAALHATRSVLDRLTAQRAWRGIDGLLRAAELLPPPLLAALLRRARATRVANLIAANVPGPSDPRYLCGQRIESLYPLMPLLDGLGLSLAAYSYDGSLHVGLAADADLVPDLDALAQAVEASLEKLRATS